MSENVQLGSSSGLDFKRASNSASARDLAQAKKLVKLISCSFILATILEFTQVLILNFRHIYVKLRTYQEAKLKLFEDSQRNMLN